MDKKISKKQVFLILFCVFYIINVFITHIINSQYIVMLWHSEEYVKILKSISYPLLCFLLLFFYKFDKSTLSDFFISIFFFVSFFISKYSIIVYVVFLLAKNVRFKYIVSSYFIATILGIIFVFFTYLFDLYNDSYLDLFRDGVYRNILGYRFPTYLPNIILSIYLCWIYIRKNKVSLFEMIIMLLISYVIFDLTDTRTVYYATILLLCSVCCLKYLNINYFSHIFISKIFRLITIFIFPIMALLCILLCFFYKDDIYFINEINKILSGRIYYGSLAIQEYGITLFGSKLEYVPMLMATKETPFFVIDMGFILFLMNHGLILMLLVSYGFMKIGYRIVRKNDPYLGISIIFFIAQMIINPYLTVLDFNPFFFLLSYYPKESIEKYV